MVLYLDNANSAVVVCVYLGDAIRVINMTQGLEWSELCCRVTKQLVSILSVQQCALCIVGHMSYMSVATVSQQLSALYNVAVPTQADQDDRVVNYAGK